MNRKYKFTVLLVIIVCSMQVFAQEAIEYIEETDNIEEILDIEKDTFIAVVSDTLVDIPAYSIYRIWDVQKVNPYDFDGTKMLDTVYIDLSGYVPPIVNKINSDFGFRRWKYHYGIDIDLNTGDTIYAAFDGMVRIAKRAKRFGYFVVLRHNNGLESIYGHLSKILVSNYQKVKAGEPIALGGSTGRSTGPHLHLEYRYLGQALNPHHIVNYSDGHKLLNDTLMISKGNYSYIEEIRKIRYHVVRRGDTLGHIAMRYGVSVNHICKINKISRNKLLRIGMRIRYT